MKKKKRYMLDIETLGTRGCPVLLQVACCDFDMKKEINLKFNKDKQPLSTVDKHTLEFWKGKVQPHGTNTLQQGFKDLTHFLNGADEVWSHNFDANIIFTICDTYKLFIPYHFTKFRDIRTLVSLSKINLDDYDWNEKTHDALDDVKFQIKYCSDAMDLIKL